VEGLALGWCPAFAETPDDNNANVMHSKLIIHINMFFFA